MNLKLLFISLFSIICTSHTKGQSNIAFSTGIDIDMNNQKPFFRIPLSLRWNPSKYREGFFIEGILAPGLNRTRKINAYTAEPLLPPEITLTQILRNSSLSAGIGGTIRLSGTENVNKISVSFSGGLCREGYVAIYPEYDRENYDIINPDVTSIINSPYLAVSGIYNFPYGSSNMFLMVRVQTPSIRGMDRYKYSYKITFPLELTYGLKFYYGKK